MTDLPASDHLAPPRAGHRGRWRTLLGAAPALLYTGIVLALFGGIAVDQLPASPLVRFALVAGGAALVVLAALWLDHRETSRG
jgi:hypothetical protein